jgi:hypothetical protein
VTEPWASAGDAWTRAELVITTAPANEIDVLHELAMEEVRQRLRAELRQRAVDELRALLGPPAEVYRAAHGLGWPAAVGLAGLDLDATGREWVIVLLVRAGWLPWRANRDPDELLLALACQEKGTEHG